MIRKNQDRFSPSRHVPQYSWHLFKTLQTPLIIYFALVGNVILGLMIGLFYFFEVNANPEVSSMFDALWWGISTVTTVGYGDVVPATQEGRIIGLGLMLTGVIFFVGFTALFVSLLLSHSDSDHKVQRENDLIDCIKSLQVQIEKLEKKIHPN